MIAESLPKLTNGVAGAKKKAAGNSRCCSLTTDTVIPVRTVGKLNSGSKRSINQYKTRRGQIKIKIFKMIAKSLKDLTIWVAGGKIKATGNKRYNCGCFTVIPAVTVGEFKSASENEIREHKLKRDQIKIQNWENDYWNSQPEERRKFLAEMVCISPTGIVSMEL